MKLKKIVEYFNEEALEEDYIEFLKGLDKDVLKDLYKLIVKNNTSEIATIVSDDDKLMAETIEEHYNTFNNFTNVAYFLNGEVAAELKQAIDLYHK